MFKLSEILLLRVGMPFMHLDRKSSSKYYSDILYMYGLVRIYLSIEEENKQI